jgi:hypothetical protein
LHAAAIKGNATSASKADACLMWFIG